MQLSDVVKFGEWMPDKGSLNNPGATVAKNVVSVGEDYAQVEVVTETTQALPAECLGMFGCQDSTGIPFTFAGTSSKLYRLVNDVWVDVGRTSNYSTLGENRWRFAQYGNFVVATNYNDVMQVFDLTSSTKFADLAGAPPRAKYIQVANNFLFAVQTNDTTNGPVSYRVWWSGLDNITTWTPSQQTQADNQDTPGYGACTGLVGSQNSAILFFVNAIFRLDYTGTPLIFTFNLSEPNKGTSVTGSIASFSNLVFYLGEDGFNVYDGSSSRPIGYEKVDNWFKDRVDLNNIHKMQAVINPRRKQVMWAFPTATGNGINDAMLIYNWVDNRWTYVEQFVESMAPVFSQAVLSDSLSVLSDSVNALSDGATYAGGRQLLGLVTQTHKLGFFSGQGRTCELETTERRLNVSGRAFVGAIYPVVDATDVQMELKSRDGQTDDYSTTGLMPVESDTGEMNPDVDARFHRVRVVLNGQWQRAQGIQIGFRRTSKR